MANKGSSAGGLDSPMTPYHGKESGPEPSQGNFYGPNMSPHVASCPPTPGDRIPTKVQFNPLADSPGPMDSPFNTAIPIGSAPAGTGGGHDNTVLDSPMTTQPKKLPTDKGGY